jgi:glycosyltransferase involved in cell wall biosynthesis
MTQSEDSDSGSGISVIVCTRNRSEDIREFLKSISSQTLFPKEVIIVDDSDCDETEKIVNKTRKLFNNKVPIIYVRNLRQKRLTVARNVGVDHAKGEILLFLDDDVTMDDRYLEALKKVYEKYPNAMGVQGYIVNQDYSHFLNSISKALGLTHTAKDKWKVLSSGEEITPFPLTQIIKCERLSGANQSFKKEVFRHNRYDENMEGLDDLDFSYRVFRKHQGSLYATPDARLIHKESTYRPSNAWFIYVNSICGSYFFYKNIRQDYKNELSFICSRVVKLVFEVCGSIGTLIVRRDSKSQAQRIRHMIRADIITLRHLNEIKKGNLQILPKRYQL